MSKKLTLADRLADVMNPAPEDPEDGYSGSMQAENSSFKDDYVPVGKSTIKEADLGSKYGMRLAGSESDSDNDSENSEEISGSETGDESEVNGHAFEGHESASDEPMPSEDEGESSQDYGSYGSDEGTGSSDEDERTSEESEGSSRGNGMENTEDAFKASVSSLRESNRRDIDKGRDVKKQLLMTDRLYESRIQIEKVMKAANALPVGRFSGNLKESPILEEAEKAKQALLRLSETLMAIRRDLEAQMPYQIEIGKKRTFSSVEDLLETLTEHEKEEAPKNAETIKKWSDKVMAASGVSAHKFRTLHQGTWAQIEEATGARERPRFVKRTRTRRTFDPARVWDEHVPGEADPETFDDADFYQQILSRIVESRALSMDDPGLARLKSINERSQRQRKNVDRRASKGRKIRYTVHDKLQNFMVPIPKGEWTDEQVDDLVHGLFGGAVNNESSDELAGLRLF